MSEGHAPHSNIGAGIMREIWFTADTHFYHSNIIRHCKRPVLVPGDLDESGGWISRDIAYKRTKEMNEMLIERWNSRVTSGDLVYHLGDFAYGLKDNPFGQAAIPSLLDRLSGRIVLIEGGHDKWWQMEFFDNHMKYHELPLGGLNIVLFHNPIESWEGRYRGYIHLHGHCHGKSRPMLGRVDVGVDTNDLYPYNFEEIKILSRMGPVV